MAAKEQLTAMEMIWGFMSGTTGHMGRRTLRRRRKRSGILHLRRHIFRV